MKRRRLYQLALLLLLLIAGGAIVNVAVAWGCAAYGGHVWSATLGFGADSFETPQFGFFICQRPGTQRICSPVIREKYLGPAADLPTRADLVEQVQTIVRENWPDGNREGFVTTPWWTDLERRFFDTSVKSQFPLVMQDANGWPVLSLKSDCLLDLSGPRQVVARVRYGFRLTDMTGHFTIPWLSCVEDFRALPTMPIVPGFAINTIFYAAVLWMVFALPGKARRYFRGKRGKCPACGYPVGSSAVCTECGKSVKEAVRA